MEINTGIEGSRSGLWSEMARIVDEVRPRYVFVENSPMLMGRGAALVIGDLAEMGYDAQWSCVSASNLGAPHQRERFWLVAHASSTTSEWHSGSVPGKKEGVGREGELDGDMPQRSPAGSGGKRAGHGRAWPLEPGVGRVADGVASRVDRIKAIGNGQVPRVAAAAFAILSQRAKLL